MILDYSKFVEEDHTEIYEEFFSPASIEIQHGFFRTDPGNCKYCRSKMLMPINDSQDRGGTDDSVHQLFDCTSCGWWKEHWLSGTYMGEGEIHATSSHRFSILREFSPDSLDVPLSALRHALNKRSGLLSKLHPTKLEQLVGSVLADHLDCEVIHLGGTGDGGIDLILVRGREQWVVQVKRRCDMAGGEGVRVIRELVGSMVLERQRKGIFVTTAGHFTKSAVSTARRAALVGAVEKIELVDLGRFVDLLKLESVREERPWMIAVDRRYER